MFGYTLPEWLLFLYLLLLGGNQSVERLKKVGEIPSCFLKKLLK